MTVLTARAVNAGGKAVQQPPHYLDDGDVAAKAGGEASADCVFRVRAVYEVRGLRWDGRGGGRGRTLASPEQANE